MGCNAAATTPISITRASQVDIVSPQVTAISTLAPSSAAVPASTILPIITPLQPTATTIPTNTPEPTPAPTTFGPLLPVAPLPPTLTGRPLFLTYSTNGRLFLGTNEAVWSWDGTTWQVYLAQYGGQRRPLGMDAAANVWLYDPEQDQVSAMNDIEEIAYPWNIPASDVYWLQADPLGRIWLSTIEDIRYLENGQWTILPLSDLNLAFEPGSSSPSFEITFAAATQIVWLTMCNWGGPGPIPGGGVRWFDGTSWQGTDSPVASGCALQVREDDSGRIWITTQSALYRYDPAHQTWEEFDYPEPPETIQDPNASYRTGPPTQFELDSTGNGWMTFTICGGGSCGIPGFTYRFDETNQWQLILIEAIEYRFGLDGQGHLWLLWPQAVPLTPDQLAKPFPLSISLTATDAAGNWWIIASITTNGEIGLWVYPTE